MKICKYIRILLSICFLFLGLLKLISIASFKKEVMIYSYAYISKDLVQYAGEIAIIVCCVETIIGLMSLFKKYHIITDLLLFFILLFFVYLTSRNLFFPSEIGTIENCGCFGDIIVITPTMSFAKSFILFLFSTFLIINKYYERIKK